MTDNLGGLTPDMVERQKLTAEGMAQFERLHAPQRREVTIQVDDISEPEKRDLIMCVECEEDFPCLKMAQMLIVQGIATVSAMIPSGNMGAILGRFAGGR